MDALGGRAGNHAEHQASQHVDHERAERKQRPADTKYERRQQVARDRPKGAAQCNSEKVQR
jgi:hypothetical protein